MIGGGTGAFIGDTHRRASRICNDFELVCGVFDADYKKSKDFAKKEGIDDNRCYENVEPMIKSVPVRPAGDRMEACSIVTPNYLHFPFAKMLLENGIHVMCEKPMTMTVSEAEETHFCSHAYIYWLPNGSPDEGNDKERYSWDNSACGCTILPGLGKFDHTWHRQPNNRSMAVGSDPVRSEQLHGRYRCACIQHDRIHNRS